MATAQKKPVIDLETYGITNSAKIYYNPSYDLLYQHETSPSLNGYEKGFVTDSGAISVKTGIFTGRSPKDKYIVNDDITKDTIWWNSPNSPNDNKPIPPSTWINVKKQVVSQLSNKALYVIDGYCGANKSSRLNVRIVTEVAWQAHFVKNMFIRPTEDELETFEPDFIVLNASKCTNKHWKEQGLNSENFTMFNLTERMQIIGGTWYGGEMKKGIFAMMNYYLPLKNIASMHCSANQGSNGEVAIFFGLSGTGKTTLSTDPKRALIGDDEHGWDDDGIFNFEGGCYAKTINLSPEDEPDIYNAIRKDALLENVVLNKSTVDYDDSSITENTRVSYPIYHIENIVKPFSRGKNANKIILLSADGFGVLPPVSILTKEQALYHFLSGFTSKLAGTERGVTEPTPTFSSCFGAAFLTLHPTKYAEVLSKRIDLNNAQCYLVNTGWNGKGSRISIKNTRKIVDSILDGSIHDNPSSKIPFFNLEYPHHIGKLQADILDPRACYDKKENWEFKAKNLAKKFIKNFEKFEDSESGKYLKQFGPTL